MLNPVTLLALLLLLLPGCALFGGGGSDRISEIHLFGLPTALALPGSTLPGGIGLRIYASEAGGSQGLSIQQGRLDVLLFDQPPAGLNPKTQKPRKVWTFLAADLTSFQSTTMMGTGYQLQLTWGQERPKGNVLTVVARYQRPGKPDLYSTPATIALTAH